MSLCDMSATQIAAYVNLWAVAVVAIVTSVVSILLYRVTTGLVREQQAYQRGYDRAIQDHAGRRDRQLALGLSDYDAQRPASPSDFPTNDNNP